MSNPFERYCGVTVNAALGTLRLPRTAIDAAQLRRLVVAGRMAAIAARFAVGRQMGVAGARFVKHPAHEALSAGRVAMRVGTQSLRLGQPAAVSPSSRTKSQNLAPGSERPDWPVQRVAMGGSGLFADAPGRRVGAVAARLGGTAVGGGTAFVSRFRLGAGGIRAGLNRFAVRLGAEAQSAAKSAIRVGGNDKIAAVGRRQLTAVSGIARRSVAPVNHASSTARQQGGVPVAASNEQMGGTAGNNQSRDMQRKLSDRLVREALLPPAAASGFDTRLGPDWHGVGSLW